MEKNYSQAGLILFIFLAVSLSMPAQDAVSIPRLSQPIVFDGIVDDTAWSEIEPLPLVTHWPTFGNPPSERTELRVAFDDAYLYVSGKMYCPEKEVFGPSYKRDLFTLGTDYLTIVLDTYNDNENGLSFSTTPTGLRLDYTVFNDAQGDEPVDPSWNSFWDAKAVRTDEGWFAEMRIPFASLNFQTRDDRVVMGMSVFRYFAQRNELDIYPGIPPDWGFWSFAKPSQMQKITLEGVRRSRPLYIAPYVTTGLQQEPRLNEAHTAYQFHNDVAFDLGLDVKYAVKDNLTLDLTINTDFAQVEADDQQVNFTRFSLFFPEKRNFFLERASIFDFSFGGERRLFYSRRVGLHEGLAVPIIAGARLVGRIGKWDMGFLNMQTGKKSNLPGIDGEIPGENFGVLRLRRQVINQYSYVGGIFTSRIANDGAYNLTYGLDGIFRLFGQDYLSVKMAQTLEDEYEGSLLSMAPIQYRLNWERRSFRGLGYNLTFNRAGYAYNPGIGFEFRRNFTNIGDFISYGWTPGDRSFLQNHQLLFYYQVFLRNEDQSVETVELEQIWFARLKKGYGGYISVRRVFDEPRETFNLSPEVGILAGDYHFYSVNAEVETPGGVPFNSTFSGSYGGFYDGRRFSAGINQRWSVSKYLELGWFYQFNRISFPVRDQELTAHLGNLRVQVTLNTKIALTAFMQYNSAADAVITNFRLRYNPREGVDLFLVFNDDLNSDRGRLDPVLPVSNSRTLLVKFTHTFRLNSGL